MTDQSKWYDIFRDNPISEGENISQYSKRLSELHDVTPEYIRKRYYQLKESLAIGVTGANSYKVVNNAYVWKAEKGIINIPVSQIDQLFWEYSAHGLDLTALEVRTEHNLKPWEWNTIKSRLSLYKASNIFSPYTWENTPPEERDAMVREKMSEKFDNEKKTVTRAYRKELETRYKEVIEGSNKERFFAQELKAELFEILPKLSTVKVKQMTEHHTGKDIVILLSDLHIGAEVDGLRLTKDFNNEILQGYLDKVTDIVNGHKAEKVTVNILGDLIESFTGMNHANSWKSLGKRMYGSKVVVKAYEMLCQFLSSINNLHGVNMIGGNHDRPTASKNDEANGEIAELIAYMLNQTLPVEIEYNHSVLAKDIYGIHYIMVHGDKGHTSKNKIPNLIFNHGNKDKFNLVVAGHLHSRIVSLDTINSRMMHVASLFTGNQYSDDLGYTSCAGFNIVENLNGLPKITDYTI